MSEKSPNNQPSWATRLDTLEQVPGEAAYDRSAAWQRLQAKLEPAPATRRFPYRIAVAALLLIAVGLFWWSGKKQLADNVAKTDTLVPPPMPLTPTNSAETSQAFTVPNSPGTSTRKPPIKPSGHAVKKLRPAQLQAPPVPLISLAPVSAPNILLTQPMAATPNPKKLNQVHLNELEGEQSTLVNDIRKPYPRRIIRRLNTLNEESLVNTIPSEIRIKINTSN